MKKIAFMHQVFLLGGAERVTCDIVRELTRTDEYEFFVFTQEYIPENMPADLLANEQLHIVEIPCLGVDSKNKKKYDWAFVINQIKHYEIDVVVSVVYSYRMLLGELKQMGCKTIFAHHSMPFWEAIPKRKIAREKSRRNIGKFLEYWFLKYPRYELLHTIDKRVYKNYLADLQDYDAFTVLCEGYKNKIANTLHLDDTLKNKIHVMPNMQKPANEVCYDKRKQFLYVGRLWYSDKRVDRLVSAWSLIADELADWELVIVGDGEERKNLEKQAAGTRGIRFEGYQNPEPYYRQASALCLVSEFEGFPLCLVEAQAQGVVPIAMDCSEGVHSIVAPDGENGMLVKPGSIDDMAQKMLQFARLSDEERLRMRHNVVNKALEYSPQHVARLWRELFD